MNTPITPFERERAADEEERRARELWVNRLSDAQYAKAREAVEHYTGK